MTVPTLAPCALCHPERARPVMGGSSRHSWRSKPRYKWRMSGVFAVVFVQCSNDQCQYEGPPAKLGLPVDLLNNEACDNAKTDAGKMWNSIWLTGSVDTARHEAI